MEEWTNRIICGDTLETLREIPDNLADCIDLSRCYCKMAQKRVAEIDAIQTEFEGI